MKLRRLRILGVAHGALGAGGAARHRALPAAQGAAAGLQPDRRLRRAQRRHAVAARPAGGARPAAARPRRREPAPAADRHRRAVAAGRAQRRGRRAGPGRARSTARCCSAWPEPAPRWWPSTCCSPSASADPAQDAALLAGHARPADGRGLHHRHHRRRAAHHRAADPQPSAAPPRRSATPPSTTPAAGCWASRPPTAPTRRWRPRPSSGTPAPSCAWPTPGTRAWARGRCRSTARASS